MRNLIIYVFVALSAKIETYKDGHPKFYIGATLQVNCTASDFRNNTFGTASLSFGNTFQHDPFSACSIVGNANNWNVTNGLIEKNFTPAFNEEYCNAANKTTEIKLMVEAVITKSYEGNVLHCVARENDGDKSGAPGDISVIQDIIGEYHA